jgi:hypothetical protein
MTPSLPPADPSAPASRGARALLLAGAVAVLALALLDGLDAPGRDYVEASLKRALLTFGVARTLNGVISVAQGTEIALQPAGLGMTLTPGEILDPVNDLIERFSSIVLLAATSLGVQRVLLDVAAWPPVTFALGMVLVAYVACAWHPRHARSPFARGVRMLAVLVLLLRFAAPAMSLASAGLYEAFLAPHYLHATAELRGTSSTLHELSEEEPVAAPEERSMLGRARDALGAAGETLDVRARIAAFTEAAANITDHTLDLIVVFVIETLLMPLACLWLALTAVRQALARLTGGG